MARDNVDSLIDGLCDSATDITEFLNKGDLSDIIDDLEQLANDSASFGGKITQICPAKIREQKDLLTNVLNQLQNACHQVADNLMALEDMLENMPHKELRGLSGNVTKARAKVRTALNTVDNFDGVPNQASIMPNTTPNTNQPLSAIAQQNESTAWGMVKKNMRFTEAENSGLIWNHIKENVSSLDIDLGDIAPEEKKQTLFEAICNSGLPKSAGDLNSAPNPHDIMTEDYSNVLPGNGNGMHVEKLNESTNVFDQFKDDTDSNGPVQEPVSKWQENQDKKMYQENLEEASHSLFEQDVPSQAMTSLTEALSTFKGSDDFDLSNLELIDRDADLDMSTHFAE